MINQKLIEEHFASVAEVYTNMRTTDREPIEYIRAAMAEIKPVKAADIGCGSGRYSLMLFEALEGLSLTCIDYSRKMLEELERTLVARGIARFEVIHSRIEEIVLAPASYDCLCSFNAVHHFDLPAYIAQVAAALKLDGQGFVYTRTSSQNAASVWGRYFPGFLEKENRLYRLSDMVQCVEETHGLEMVAARRFRFLRRSILERILTQARNKHYSTFSLYNAQEMESALARFEANIRENFCDPNEIDWYDGNTMLHFRRTDYSKTQR